jgi:hypothetical protein
MSNLLLTKAADVERFTETWRGAVQYRHLKRVMLG